MSAAAAQQQQQQEKEEKEEKDGDSDDDHVDNDECGGRNEHGGDETTLAANNVNRGSLTPAAARRFSRLPPPPAPTMVASVSLLGSASVGGSLSPKVPKRRDKSQHLTRTGSLPEDQMHGVSKGGSTSPKPSKASRSLSSREMGDDALQAASTNSNGLSTSASPSSSSVRSDREIVLDNTRLMGARVDFKVRLANAWMDDTLDEKADLVRRVEEIEARNEAMAAKICETEEATAQLERDATCSDASRAGAAALIDAVQRVAACLAAHMDASTAAGGGAQIDAMQKLLGVLEVAVNLKEIVTLDVLALGSRISAVESEGIALKQRLADAEAARREAQARADEVRAMHALADDARQKTLALAAQLDAASPIAAELLAPTNGAVADVVDGVHTACRSLGDRLGQDFVLGRQSLSMASAVPSAMTWTDGADVRYGVRPPDGGPPPIYAGDINRLVQRLTHAKYPDVEFQKQFLLTYRSFMTPAELLERLVLRYCITPSPGVSKAAVIDVKEIFMHVQKPVQLRVLNVIKYWIENFAYDFRDPNAAASRRRVSTPPSMTSPDMITAFMAAETVASASSAMSASSSSEHIDDALDPSKRAAREDLVKQLTSFLTDVVGPRSRLTQPLLALLERKLAGRNRPATVLVQSQQAPPLIVTDLGRIMSGDFGFSDVSAEECARQLSLVHHACYKAIRPKEFLNLNWSRRGKHVTAPNLMRMIHLFNGLGMWVATNTVKVDALLPRRDRIEYFINVASHCYDFNNFNGALSIISGLSNSAVHRLHRTWSEVKAPLKARYEEIRSLMADNYKLFRSRVQKVNPPCIPYVGIFLTDITFMEEGHADYIDGKLINFNKLRLVAETIHQIQRYQQESYNFHSCLPIQQWCTRYEENLDDNDLYNVSLRCETKKLNKFFGDSAATSAQRSPEVQTRSSSRGTVSRKSKKS
jgi:RasGEF domain/RasGEF N-terminal motif